MGYRGEDVSATPGTWGRETPWHSSSDDYPAADGAGQGYRADAGYPEQGQDYGQRGGQYVPSHGQQEPYNDPYGQQAQPGQYDYQQPGGGAEGYGQPGAHEQRQDYGYGQAGSASGYGQDSYEQGGYEHRGGYGAAGGSYAEPGAGYQGGTYQSGAYPGYDDGSQGQGARGYTSSQGDGGYPGTAAGYSGRPGYSGNAGYSGDPGYSDPAGYGQPGGYQSPSPASGGHRALPAGSGYEAQDSASGYPARGGSDSYTSQNGAGGYPTQNGSSGSYAARSGSYPSQNGSGSYPSQNGSGSYPAQNGSGGYPAQNGSGSYAARSGSYPSQNEPGGYASQDRSGGYPAQAGTGSYAARSGSGSYPGPDAGNDWYGGQPAAANGASFADTGSYRLSGRVSDEYGTGPRGALSDQTASYTASGPLAADQLPTSVIPAVSAPLGGGQPDQRSGPQQAYHPAPTAQRGAQDAYANAGTASYPRFGQDDAGGRGGYGATAVDDGYGDYAAGPPSATGYDDYGSSRAPGGGYGGFDPADQYQDQYDDEPDTRSAGGGRAGRGPRGGGSALGPLRGKRLLIAALVVVAVGIIGVALYAFVFKSKPAASNPNAAGPLPSGSAVPSQQACEQTLGTYCHIESRTDDPAPLTTAELYPPAFTNEADKSSYSLASTKTDTTCSKAVIGSTLVSALKAGHCTQVLRASYVSGDGKIMGTIGVVNLATTNEAHDAGKVVGQKDFIAPLTAAKGVASKLGNGTGVVEAEYKGHYLILTWSEYVNGTTPKTTAQDNQLEAFGNGLVAGTANVTLSQRMVNGTSSASPSASASAKASAKKS